MPVRWPEVRCHSATMAFTTGWSAIPFHILVLRSPLSNGGIPAFILLKVVVPCRASLPHAWYHLETHFACLYKFYMLSFFWIQTLLSQVEQVVPWKGMNMEWRGMRVSCATYLNCCCLKRKPPLEQCLEYHINITRKIILIYFVHALDAVCTISYLWHNFTHWWSWNDWGNWM